VYFRSERLLCVFVRRAESFQTHHGPAVSAWAATCGNYSFCACFYRVPQKPSQIQPIKYPAPQTRPQPNYTPTR
jgi:hypothetical protein